jgi:carbonic anhydrase/acetyltransferase-like protein (isoleucine patch superfamily)
MIRTFSGHTPKLSSTVFIAPSAEVIGNVEIGEGSSIWFGAVVRGDVHFIRIGCRTSIQDGSVLHVTRVTYPLIVGDEVTVGHRVTLHGCTVKDRCLIGMGATLLDGAVVGEESMIGAGALVPEGMVVPPRTLALGVPAKIKRGLTDEELAFFLRSAQNYVELAGIYLKEGR